MENIFIVNPKAGRRNSLQYVGNEIKRLGLDASVYETKGPLDAGAFVRSTLSENPDRCYRFIACGGDGTVNEVFSAAVGKENAQVSVFPCGSGNDFVKAFGGKEVFSDLKALLEAPVRKIDAIEVNGRFSVNVTNFGFDSQVARVVNDRRLRKGHGGKLSYLLGIMKALVTSMDNRCSVSCDGKSMNPDGRFLLCTISNGTHVGGSFCCAPKSLPDDGLLDVCLVKPVSRLRFFSLVGKYINGSYLDDERLGDIFVYTRAKSITVTAPEGFSYTLDGEVICENEFTANVVPLSINFACPDGLKER